MIYIAAALALLAMGALVLGAWRRTGDWRMLLKGAVLVGVGALFVSLSRSMIVYVPLMVLHLAAVILYWIGAVAYLLGRRFHPALLAAPWVTAALFFAVAWWFREV